LFQFMKEYGMSSHYRAVRCHRLVALLLMASVLLTGLPPVSHAQDADPPAAGPTLALTSPAVDGTILATAADANFAATASADLTGSDGAGIAVVTFTLADDYGQTIVTTHDTTPPYCAVEATGGCAVLDADTFATLAGQTVRLTVVAEATSGLTTTLTALFPIAPPVESAALQAESAAVPDAPAPVVWFSVPEPQTTVTARSDTVFAVSAYDPTVGSSDGAGIAFVEVQLRDGDTILHRRRERTLRYCVFGNNGPCDPMPSDLWRELDAGDYTLWAQATTRRGGRSAWIRRTVTIRPTHDVEPPSDTMQTFQTREIPFSAPDIVNPLRGLYRWQNQEYAPQPRPAYDSYERYAWHDLEPRRGQYDFSMIERDLDAAQRSGRKHALRIRAMIHGQGPVVPDDLVDQMGRGWWSHGTYVPDWNDPDFLDRMGRLIAELGRRYNGDPRIAWVDVGFYGNWGEWHTWPLTYPARNGAVDMSTANKRQIVDRMATAFPDTQLIMGSEDEATLVYALRKYPTMGWRRDSLGSWIFDENSTFRNLRRSSADWELVMERWQAAPIISEFISPNDQRDPDVYRLAQQQAKDYHVSLVSNGNTLAWERLSGTGRTALLQLGKSVGYRLVLDELAMSQGLHPGGSFRVTSRWINRGNAPVYERWQPTLELRDDAGRVRWRGRLDLDLADLLPSDRTTSFDDQFTLPDDFAPGRYDLVLVIRDPADYREPLALVIQGRQRDGSYGLGEVVVGLAGERHELSLRQATYRLLLPLMRQSVP
jgi:hypothetical protein